MDVKYFLISVTKFLQYYICHFSPSTYVKNANIKEILS